VLAQLGGVASWDDFQRVRIALDPAALVDQATRDRLTALPGMVRVRGDAAPVDYEIQEGEGVARIRLREGQAKRLRPEEVPAMDRPVRFAVQRGRHPPVLADTLPELLALLRKAPRYEREERGEPGMAGKRGRGRGSGRRGRPPRARDGRPGRRR
jgi:ATP-dependent helicase HrpA